MKKNKKSKSNIEYWEDREVQKLKGQMKDLNKLEKLLRKEYAQAPDGLLSDMSSYDHNDHSRTQQLS